MRTALVAMVSGALGAALGVVLSGGTPTPHGEQLHAVVGEGRAGCDERAADGTRSLLDACSAGVAHDREDAVARSVGVPPADATRAAGAPGGGRTRAERAVSAQIDAMVARARQRGAAHDATEPGAGAAAQEPPEAHTRAILGGMLAGFESGLAQAARPKQDASGRPDGGGRE